MLPATSTGAAPSHQPSLPNGRWEQLSAWLVYRRVRITLAVFAVLLVKNVLEGIEPHGLFAYRDPVAVAGCMLIFAGLAIRSWSAGILRKNRELTKTGPYAIVRNPLYVGSFLIMCGFCTMISDVGNVLAIVGPIGGLYFLQVLHEERYLAKVFAGQWNEYARSVPRFLPRSLPKAAFAPWDARQWLGSREYNALGATLLGMLALELWRLS
ncbi:MAG TPA: isoprenylcysteine carboxylmethyltransferase family protein [Lacipirellula sp.]